jgi:death-on-curing family protein
MKERLRRLTVKEVEFIAYELAQELFASFKEPIPDFSTRFPDKLESCLAAPFQGFSRKDFYPNLLSKAAALFYLVNKNHPFQNGNKRLAVTILLVLLYKNGKWLKVSPIELYNFAKWVASSPAGLSDSIMFATEEFLKKYLVEMHPTSQTL